jgi:hypothetical protein
MRVSAPFGLDSAEVHGTAVPVELPDEAAASTGVRFYVMHPVLCVVAGLPDALLTRDPFLVLADYPAYAAAQQEVENRSAGRAWRSGTSFRDGTLLERRDH